MLSGGPVEIGWNCDASEAIFFDGNLRFLIDAILEASPKPGVDVTWNIDSCCGDKVVPVDVLKSIL